MAYPSVQSIRPEIRNNGNPVSDARISELISEGIEMVTLGLVGAEENAYSRRAVRHYVKAEVLRIMRELGDRIPQESIDAADTAFTHYSDQYRSLTASTADDAGARAKVQIGSTPW